MKIERVEAYRLSIPFIEETVVPFARHRIMQSVILRVFACDYIGISETTGNPGFSGESAEGILIALNYIVPNVLGTDPRQFRRLHTRMDAVVGNPAAKAGIDIACHDLVAKVFGVPLPILLGGLVHERVATQHLLPIKPLDEIATYARKFSDAGYRIFEVKVESDPLADIKRIETIQANVAPGSVLIIDANRRGSVHDSIRFLSALEPANIYMEQPVNGLAQMAEVRRHSRIPIIADEQVKSLADVVQIIEADSADALSIKLVKVGGFLPAMQIATYAESVGVPFRVDDMCMSRLGNTATYTFASAWENIFGCGFAQHTLLIDHEKLVPVGVKIDKGYGTLDLQPGVGGEIDLEAIGPPVAEWAL
ncbi:MAG: enolase C-terminal domain-like protein [Thermodesulfobacteriota bacterium]|nr:enolase C-terminal domain-like protein [Thermodesulfobacteriota bacterium]